MPEVLSLLLLFAVTKCQPSAEILRVECAKCRRECDLPAARATLCADRACRVREMQARGVLCSITLVRGAAGELEDENWRLCRPLEYAEYLGSWKMRTGDLVVQL